MGLPVSACKLGQPRGQQRGVTAELVDQEPADEPLVVGFEHRDGAEQVREQPAAVDVADDHDGQVRGAGQTHVGEIGCPQVDLGRRARALHDDGIEFGSQAVQFVGDDRRQTLAVGEVVPAPTVSTTLPRTTSCEVRSLPGLSRTGLNRTLGARPAALRLHRLGAADLAALDGDRRVVGHVLRLERRDPNALAGQQPAQPGDDHGLAGVGGGAGDQQRAAAHGVTFLLASRRKVPFFCGVSGAFAYCSR